MAFPLQNSTIEEQRDVIRFLIAEGSKPTDIQRLMVAVYGGKLCIRQIFEKVESPFSWRPECLSDDQRLG